MNKLTLPSARHVARRRAGGFTLVELVAVLTTAAALTALAGPALASAIASVRLAAGTDAVLANLSLARGEAIKRNARVVYCKSHDGTACAAEGGWESGGIVFHDANNNGTREPPEAVIYHQQPLAGPTLVKGNLPVAAYVSYNQHGLAQHAGSGAFQAGTITLCHPSPGPTQGRQIIINSGGRPRVQKVMLEQCA